ncbi:MAG TPA: hypothetical protein PKA12_10450 [Saprospiraceae bacterium]|nr:hypothetical protein [Saprospiraceae bacterium]
MLSGKSNVLILGILMLINILSQSCNLASCDESCQEREFNKKIDLGRYNQDAINFYNKLNSLTFSSNEVKEIDLSELFEQSISRIVLIERMSVDFSKPCQKLNLDQVLKDKEYCQVLKVEYSNHEIGYIIGRCEYDLMGFTKSYCKIGFDLSNKVQYLLPSDKLSIIFNPGEREKFSIYSKDYRPFEINCN